MTKCIYCKFESEKPEGYRRFFCDNCVKDKEIGVSFIPSPKVKLPGGMVVTQARINELERRVILPYESKEKGDYFVGRRGENGKIQEREPRY